MTAHCFLPELRWRQRWTATLLTFLAFYLTRKVLLRYKVSSPRESWSRTAAWERKHAKQCHIKVSTKPDTPTQLKKQVKQQQVSFRLSLKDHSKLFKGQTISGQDYLLRPRGKLLVQTCWSTEFNQCINITEGLKASQIPEAVWCPIKAKLRACSLLLSTNPLVVEY